MKTDVISLVSEVAGKAIFAIDHFERILDPAASVQDKEIRSLLSIIAEAPQAKLIITSRIAPDLNFLPQAKTYVLDGCPIGRFPTSGNHVENVLSDFVNLAELGAESYPESLLRSIDRHPYLTVLAGLTLKKDGIKRLSDPSFLENLADRMRDDLLRNLVDDGSRAAVKWLSLIRIPIPRPILETLAGKASVESAENAGLLYQAYDPFRKDLVTSLGAIRRASGYSDDLLTRDDLDNEPENVEEREDQKRIALAYEELYRTDNDPRWLRELCYHKLATGNAREVQSFGAYYKTEISWAGDYMYRVRKDYGAALWALEAAKNLGLQSLQSDMRRASCMVRLGNAEGERLFERLIGQYPEAIHIKNAHVDSLLYMARFCDALAKLEEYQLEKSSSAWVAHEYGRAYFGLRKYGDAVGAFEMQIRMEKAPKHFIYDSLARAYQHQGDLESELRVITTGLARHPASNRLRLRHASHLVRMATPDSLSQAKPILEELYSNHQTDGRVLQQYCKLLCRIGAVDQARHIWEAVGTFVSPAEYRTPIHVEILMQEQNWERALAELRQISDHDEHLVGMKKEVYLAWAKAEPDIASRRSIAEQGLNVQMDDSLLKNIPLLLTSARLARLAGNDEIFAAMVSKIEAINPKAAQWLQQRGEEYLTLWEGENFALH